ncbi:MAG TPA: hypothetical protein VMZ91_04015 [Candidatus Paceibacterota bacterium]|nr:hypothetical protein [Candidatus Paceibacterota bacterium]HUU49941.1 hypothetical protein [Nitrospinota bacterium]
MSDISDTVKSLYEKFLMRDLLSFITPGSIVVLSIYLLGWGLDMIKSFFESLPFLLYIPIFGFLYIVGFATQYFGRLFRLIRIHNRNNENEHLNGLRRVLQRSNKEIQQHERFVVLKQMCGNNAVAILIAGFILAFKYPIWFLVTFGVIVFICLILGHYHNLLQQEIWEDFENIQTQDN